MDVLTSLMWRAALLRAAAVEQWAINHRMCDPQPLFDYSNDNSFVNATCSCGDRFEATLVCQLTTRVIPKAERW